MPLAVFRVDGAPFMGIGHIMRCLTLAEKLRCGGWDIRFISRAFENHFTDVINQKGFECALLPKPEELISEVAGQTPPHAHWLGVDWRQDVKETLSTIKHCDLLVADHYGIDKRWHKSVREVADRILVIDDLADRALDCDILLDQTYGRDGADYDGLTPRDSQKLCGSDYMLLRDVFYEKRDKALRGRETIEGISRVFICMGSGDPTNVTGRILEALNRHEPNLHLDIILSSKAPYLKDVQTFETHHILNIHTDCPNVEDLMIGADIAFGAGGTMSWERCCLGLPTLLAVIADNQRLIAEKLEDAGAVKNIGWHETLTADDVYACFTALNSEDIKSMSEKAASICDGEGTTRVLKALGV